MNEIKTDDNLKRKIINSVKEKKFKHNSHFFTQKKAVAGIAVACIFALVMVFAIPFIQNNRDIAKQEQSKVQSLFDSFVITAYAADGTPFEIKPNVDFPLGEYQLTMSSAPGFPLKIVCKDADTIKLTVTDGEFLLWTPPDGRVNSKGETLEIKSGDLIYWTPRKEANPKTIASNCTISINAYKNNKKLGSNSIKIESDNNNSYIGGLAE
jgi:hypothetical protein